MNNEYKEKAFGFYHNMFIDMTNVFCSSAPPQLKVDKAMEMIINTAQEIAVISHKIKKARTRKKSFKKSK